MGILAIKVPMVGGKPPLLTAIRRITTTRTITTKNGKERLMNEADIARAIGTSHQNFYDMKRKCARNPRNFGVPAHYVKVLAELADMDPADFRPDVYTR